MRVPLPPSSFAQTKSGGGGLRCGVCQRKTSDTCRSRSWCKVLREDYLATRPPCCQRLRELRKEPERTWSTVETMTRGSSGSKAVPLFAPRVFPTWAPLSRCRPNCNASTDHNIWRTRRRALSPGGAVPVRVHCWAAQGEDEEPSQDGLRRTRLHRPSLVIRVDRKNAGQSCQDGHTHHRLRLSSSVRLRLFEALPGESRGSGSQRAPCATTLARVEMYPGVSWQSTIKICLRVRKALSTQQTSTSSGSVCRPLRRRGGL